MGLLDVILLVAVVYGTLGVLNERKGAKTAVREPGFQNLSDAARLHPPPHDPNRDIELPLANEVAAVPNAVAQAFSKSLIHNDPQLASQADEYVRAHAVGRGDVLTAPKQTIRQAFFGQQNTTYLRARLQRAGIGNPTLVTLRDVQTQVYGENPGELPPVEVLGGNIPDTSKLCGCRAADPVQHVNLLNEETVSRLVAAIESARRDAEAYKAITSAWTEPPEIPPSAKSDSTAMEFSPFA